MDSDDLIIRSVVYGVVLSAGKAYKNPPRVLIEYALEQTLESYRDALHVNKSPEYALFEAKNTARGVFDFADLEPSQE